MKICGWSDLKTMQYYVRLAGVDERVATDRRSPKKCRLFGLFPIKSSGAVGWMSYRPHVFSSV